MAAAAGGDAEEQLHAQLQVEPNTPKYPLIPPPPL